LRVASRAVATTRKRAPIIIEILSKRSYTKYTNRLHELNKDRMPHVPALRTCAQVSWENITTWPHTESQASFVHGGRGCLRFASSISRFHLKAWGVACPAVVEPLDSSAGCPVKTSLGSCGELDAFWLCGGDFFLCEPSFLLEHITHNTLSDNEPMIVGNVVAAALLLPHLFANGQSWLRIQRNKPLTRVDLA
jgi:hypothetical protein